MCNFCGEAYLQEENYQFGADQPLTSAAVTATSSVSSTGNLWDGVLDNSKWGTLNLTFSFPTSSSAYSATYGLYGETSTFSALSSTQQSVARTLLDQIEEFTNLTFTEVSANSSSSIMKFGETSAISTALGYFPNNFFEEGGDTWYRSGSYETPVLGNYAYNEGFMHEIGHALGLRHGHDSANNPFGALATAYDSNEFSVMTYRDHVGDGTGDGSENETWGNAQSYMMFDIAALQHMYGADYSSSGNVWSGGSTYTFSTSTGEMFINGVGQGTPGGNRIFRTIWDGHGEDTYDLSNYTTELIIDLRPGEWSTFDTNQLADLDGGSRSFNLARGNVANALLSGNDLGSLIENAIGGSNNDRLIGNIGDNILNGQGGSDTAVFSAAMSATKITSFFEGLFLKSATDGLDQLINIESVEFSDRTVSTSALSPQHYALEYGASYTDLYRAFGANNTALLDHFRESGSNEGRVVSFHGMEYIASYADLSNAFGADRVAGINHYYDNGHFEGRANHFNALEYVASYGDLINAFGADIDAGAAHYIVSGRNEGRAEIFDSRFYLGNYADLRSAFGTDIDAAATHYIVSGVNEGRSANFSGLEYIASYGDLIQAFGANQSSGINHFLDNGFNEGRGDSFDAYAYLNAAGNQDLSLAFGNDFVSATIHYIENGYYEGRATA
ncbi:MAG: M10 family metallopeptidase [Lentilitoribacter sp.]